MAVLSTLSNWRGDRRRRNPIRTRLLQGRRLARAWSAMDARRRCRETRAGHGVDHSALPMPVLLAAACSNRLKTGTRVNMHHNCSQPVSLLSPRPIKRSHPSSWARCALTRSSCADEVNYVASCVAHCVARTASDPRYSIDRLRHHRRLHLRTRRVEEVSRPRSRPTARPASARFAR